MSSKIAETRRRDRNAIARDNEVAIAQKDLEARQQTLTIKRTRKEAGLSQERDIANKTASTRAEVANCAAGPPATVPAPETTNSADSECDGEFVLCKRNRLCYTQPRANDWFAFSSVAQR